jgi:hypothetical protein
MTTCVLDCWGVLIGLWALRPFGLQESKAVIKVKSSRSTLARPPVVAQRSTSPDPFQLPTWMLPQPLVGHYDLSTPYVDFEQGPAARVVVRVHAARASLASEGILDDCQAVLNGALFALHCVCVPTLASN